MAAAIFGLIGVLVGGVLNFVTSMYLQSRKQRSSLRSIARRAVLATLEQTRTLEELGIGDGQCRVRRGLNYGREVEP